MKKRLFYAISVFTITLITLTSCLGDTESKRTLTNQYAYIDSDDTGTFANLYYLGIRSNDLATNGLRPGDCARISFKYNLNNSYGDGTFKADYVTVREEDIYKWEDHVYSRAAEVDTTASAYEENKKHYFESIENNSVFGYPTAFWGNKWFFQFKYAKGKGNLEPILRVTYDESKQNNKDGAKEAGVRYIDLELIWDGDNTVIGDIEYISKIVVLDLTTIRDVLENEEEALKEKNVKIYLRYLKGDIKKDPVNPKTEVLTSNIEFNYKTDADY